MKYYIHIPLLNDLRDRVAAIELKYGGTSKSEPHITLIPPRKILEYRSEQELIKAISSYLERRRRAVLYGPVIIQKEVGYFEDGDGNKETIYIGIEKSIKLSALHETLNSAVSGILKPADGLFADFATPHITLLTHLSPGQGERIWEELRNMDFRGQFMCNGIVLLRKGQQDERWQQVMNLAF